MYLRTYKMRWQLKEPSHQQTQHWSSFPWISRPHRDCTVGTNILVFVIWMYFWASITLCGTIQSVPPVSADRFWRGWSLTGRKLWQYDGLCLMWKLVNHLFCQITPFKHLSIFSGLIHSRRRYNAAISHQNPHKTHRIDMGLLCLNCDLYSALLTAAMYAVSCYTRLCYNGTLLY